MDGFERREGFSYFFNVLKVEIIGGVVKSNLSIADFPPKYLGAYFA